jgi:hypothetical protein
MRRTIVPFISVVLTALITQLAPAAARAGVPDSPGDCCNPEAVKKIAATLGFADIVGVKLGMSPQQALAAIRAYDPKLKIEIMNAFITIPSSGQIKVPHLAVAHTVNPRVVGGPGGFNQVDGSSEEIVIEFTTPPSPALVAKITRRVAFPGDQPVPASNLLDSLRKKYGQESFSDGVSRDWIYDSTGTLVTRTVTTPERACLPQNTSEGFPDGQVPTADDVARGNGGNITLATTTLDESSNLMTPERRAICRSFVIFEDFGLGSDVAPNRKMNKLDVTLQSGALLYNSRKATHDWLQSDAGAKNKKLDEAAEGRTGPKL